MTITLTRKLVRATLFTLLATSVACAADTTGTPGEEDPDGDGDGDGDGDSDGDGTPDDEEQPLDATGSYSLDSRFDLVSSMPGTVGEVVNTFVEMTDDPYDPATWLLDTLQAEWDGGWVEDLMENARPFLDGVVHEVMMNNAPELVQQLIDIGDAFGQATRKFGVNSVLMVQDDPDGFASTHTVNGYHFEIDSTDFAFTLVELGSDSVIIDGVGFSMEDDVVNVSEHSVPLRYGGFLAMALEEVIIPMVNPNAYSLPSLLDELIDCYPIGERVSEEIGYGSPEFYEGLCEMGLDAGANFVINKLISIDEQAEVQLVISGSARAQDQNSDRRVDRLINGKWNGAIDYAGNTGALATDKNTFSGQRM